MARADSILTIEDANIAAFLAAEGYTVIPFVKNKDRDADPVVAWEIYGDKNSIRGAIQDYYNNTLIGVHDFVKSLKEIRGGMYNLKSISQQ